MTAVVIRDAGGGDATAVAWMNEAEVQWTSPMDIARLATLAGLASYYRVAEVDGQIAGFVLAMHGGCGYENENFEWFEERYSRFLYIDRVVVAKQYTGQKVGSTLYQDVFFAAGGLGLERVVCEYNWLPRNVPSERFHARLGFKEVGQRTVASATKVLSMQYRAITLAV